MASEATKQVYPAPRLEAFIKSALVAHGLPEQDAAVCAARMIESDLRGVDTHGIFRLPHYSQRIRVNGVNLRPTVRTVRENAVTALVDGDNAMGHVVMTYATELAIRKAEAAGLAWVGTCNGNHAGPGPSIPRCRFATT